MNKTKSRELLGLLKANPNKLIKYDTIFKRVLGPVKAGVLKRFDSKQELWRSETQKIHKLVWYLRNREDIPTEHLKCFRSRGFMWRKPVDNSNARNNEKLESQ